ncbi:hypothetical protein AAVH_15029 [Aphelenchoides avenae]|nr:hypothetical protein AAVH_15029 [Aphelenchus avenae]
MHDSFIRMDAFLFLSRRWLDTCQVTCTAWRNHIEEKSEELALRNIYVLSFDRTLRLTLPPLFPDSVCETRVAELKELKRNAAKLSAKNEAFNAEKIKRHLQNSYVQYFAHSLHESNDFDRLRDVTGIHIGHLLSCRPLQLHVLDSYERFNVTAATFSLETASDLARLSREGCFARADEVLVEYFIMTKLYYDALRGDELDAMYHMEKCRRLSISVGSEYSTVNVADLVDLDHVINHFLASDKTSGFVRQLEMVSPKSAPLKRPTACQAPPHSVVDHLPYAEHLPGKQYEVYKFPCKKTSDVLTVIIWTTASGQHIYRLQRGPFSG